MPLLEVTSLSAAYGSVPALHRVDFVVNAGEIVGILGHNGMGKTTLMRSIMGFVRTTGGDIRYDGRSITGLSVNARARAGIGFVPQGRQIFPNLSVEENLHVGIRQDRVSAAKKADEIVALFPRLKRLLDRQGAALSGGEQQLLALARCLCTNPRLILLDEPTEGIQPNILDEITETLLGLMKGTEMAIVLVEQNVDFIAGLASRVYALSNGVVERELPREHLTDPVKVNQFIGFA
ncbi:ABC transporter ATP-binding protein [Agrobacterium sp. NPDC090283]|uniref:ABC transporter ATP-binding protein n=1 Tax=Agrobacterium sp. NPDC090283 TaxID=3363920 RepID=UPI00383B492C